MHVLFLLLAISGELAELLEAFCTCFTYLPLELYSQRTPLKAMLWF